MTVCISLIAVFHSELLSLSFRGEKGIVADNDILRTVIVIKK